MAHILLHLAIVIVILALVIAAIRYLPNNVVGPEFKKILGVIAFVIAIIYIFNLLWHIPTN